LATQERFEVRLLNTLTIVAIVVTVCVAWGFVTSSASMPPWPGEGSEVMSLLGLPIAFTVALWVLVFGLLTFTTLARRSPRSPSVREEVQRPPRRARRDEPWIEDSPYGSRTLAVLTVMSALTLTSIGVLCFSLSGTHGCGAAWGFIGWVLLTGGIWALIFTVAVIVDLIRQRRVGWIGLLAFTFFCRIVLLPYLEWLGAPIGDVVYVYAWLPVDVFAAFLCCYSVGGEARTRFVVVNLLLLLPPVALVLLGL